MEQVSQVGRRGRRLISAVSFKSHPPNPGKLGFILPILQMRTLSPREVKKLAKGRKLTFI